MLKAGNIWSGSKKLAVLTNPTEIAYRKGNLKNHYPISYKKVTYRDSEAFYQSKARNRKADNDFCYWACKYAIILKFQQYPAVFKAVKDSGGIEFLRRCSHIVYGKNLRWEGYGINSGYIRCLISAYKFVERS